MMPPDISIIFHVLYFNCQIEIIFCPDHCSPTKFAAPLLEFPPSETTANPTPLLKFPSLGVSSLHVPLMRFLSLGDGNRSTSLLAPFRLAYEQSKPSAMVFPPFGVLPSTGGIFLTVQSKLAHFADGIFPTRRQQRRHQPTVFL